MIAGQLWHFERLIALNGLGGPTPGADHGLVGQEMRAARLKSAVGAPMAMSGALRSCRGDSWGCEQNPP